MSLRRFLLWTLGGSIVSLLSISLLLGYHNATEQMEEIFDAELAQHAKILARLHTNGNGQTVVIESWHDGREVSEEMEEQSGEDAEYDTTGHAYENKIAFQIWDANQKLLKRSATAPDTPLAAFSAGYYDAHLHGHTWRVFVLPTSKKTTIVVAHRDDVRSELASEIAINNILPALAILPVILFTVLYVIRRATRPLTRLTGEIESRNSGQLTPFEISDVPTEVQPLVIALNNMMQRVKTSFEQQRRFIADAAHELRTPLAALQIHSENAQNSSGSEQRHSLTQLQQGIARSAHLVEQLLTLSRLEHQRQKTGGMPRIESCSLQTLLLRITQELNIVAQRRQQTLRTDLISDCQVLATPTQLTALLRNICDNALRYSPEGSEIGVQLKHHQQRCQVYIRDQGPGIPAELRERVFEPFFRELGHDTTGTGLGLAIAKEIVTQLNGRIELSDNTPHGLVVLIELPCVGHADH